MRANPATMIVLGLGLTACGGGGPDGSATDDVASGGAEAPAGGDAEDASSAADDTEGDVRDSGEIVDPQPPGQATVSVDGQEWTLTEPGAGDCSIAADAITFSFRIVDNEFTLGAGANLYDT
jgi:hypothetical protein